jgi:hypothetical protein
MQRSKDLVEQAARAIAASQTTSAIAAGPAEQPTQQPAEGASHVDAINQVFALFRLNYHNQYYAAYPDAEQLSQIKRLWLHALQALGTEQILRGARHAIEHSEYLPTLHRMLESCRAAATEEGLPDPRTAFREACAAPRPKHAQHWSHPAVYLTGRDVGWFFLSNSPESQTWPVFRERYRHWCDRVLAGETLALPAPAATSGQAAVEMAPESRRAALAALRRTWNV